MSMTNPDFRALCAELLAAIQLYTKLNPAAYKMSAFELTEKLMDAMAATTAALAQPEPVAPTDEELLRLAAQAFDYAFVDGGVGGGESEFLAYARAVLARWGTPTNTINQEDYDHG
jgi:hypothetical protein